MAVHKLVVFSSLFPNSEAPGNGLFVRERMLRVAKHTEMVIVSPRPWFPGQSLIRLFKPDYRPTPRRPESYQGVTVYFPRFLSVPGVFRHLDGRMMAWCSYSLLKKLKREHGLEIIDSHFTYPDGWAACWLAKRLGMKATITLRGTEVPHSDQAQRRAQLQSAWGDADKLFTVSESLRQHAIELGTDPVKIKTIGNGIDTDKFKPMAKEEARAALGLPKNAKVLITVGGLVERKGFHRVVECLPALSEAHPELFYLIAGGANAEGNYEPQIRELCRTLGVEGQVRFLGALPPDQLSTPLSAADVFVLSTRNEGWANVILEAMACGTPVVASDVGGNAEVVNSPDLGTIVPFGDPTALAEAIADALNREWDQARLVSYAQDNHWDKRVETILLEYDQLMAGSVEQR